MIWTKTIITTQTGTIRSRAGSRKTRTKNLVDRARKEYEMEPKPWESMLEVRPASKWITRAASSPELFGPLWREGEVAVPFGESGVGKSLLAVQIAESIARGTCKISAKKSKPRPTLLFDFEQTAQQFTERYSIPSPIPGKLPAHQRFKFQRAGMAEFDDVPKAFKGDLGKFMWHSIINKISDSDARIIIIDNISYLAKNIASNSECGRLMKTLKFWAATKGLSILVVAQAKARRRPSSPPGLRRGADAASAGWSGGRGGRSTPPIELTDIAGSRHIGEMADTVFALGRSTFAEDFRYIKHLKSRNTTLEHNEQNVITCQLTCEAIISPSPVSRSLVSAHSLPWLDLPRPLDGNRSPPRLRP